MHHFTDQQISGIANILLKGSVMPVLTPNSMDACLAQIDKLQSEEGIEVFEITLRTSAGLETIAAARSRFPDLVIGAGTVNLPEHVSEARDAGAQFLVSPGLTGSLLDEMVLVGLPVLPGIATASELLLGYQRGLRQFKFFPAEAAGGIPMLKSFYGPFPDVSFCPTGGIRGDNYQDYLALPNVVTVGGTWLGK